MDLYSINKNAVAALPPLEITEEVLNKIDRLHERLNNVYYMLLCRDMNYYTIFYTVSNWAVFGTACTKLGETVVDCLKNVGTIKSIEPVDYDNAIEIWIDTVDNEENPVTYCMYLFPYDEGVVGFRG